MEAKTGSTGYIKIFLNNIEVNSLPLNGAGN